jgi:hypothetical protein
MTALKAAIAELREAAWREGIRPESPLGTFVLAQERLLSGLADEITDLVAKTKGAADSEAERMRVSVATVDAQLRRIDAELRRAEIHRKNLETKTVGDLTKAVAEKLKDVLVIREYRWNRRDRHISWGAAAAAALVILLGGYTWRGVQDRLTYANATEAWARCQDTAFVDKASGRPFCQIELTRLPPPAPHFQ